MILSYRITLYRLIIGYEVHKIVLGLTSKQTLLKFLSYNCCIKWICNPPKENMKETEMQNDQVHNTTMIIHS